MSLFERIGEPATLARLGGALATIAPHNLPLIRAVQARTLAVVAPTRNSPGSFLRRIEAGGRPVIVLIGDDDHASTGPAGWRCAARLNRWTRATMVHGSGANPAHYEAAVFAARGCGRVVLIECVSAHAPAWRAVFEGRCPVLLIEPPAGGVHPAPAARGEVH